MKLARLFLPVLLLLPVVHGQDAPLFDFHSGFWVNLHHFLYEQALKSGPSSDSPEWRRALEYYRANLVKHDQLDRDMEAINNTLSDRESETSLKGSGLQPDLIAVLDDAAPEYRKRWWPAHDRANQKWIAAARPLIQKYGAALTRKLAEAYGMPWPKDPIRTDVSEYANWGGAYTTLFPTHITVSSTNSGNQGQAALEVLFHEASHALILDIRDAISRQVRADGRTLRKQDLWHAVQFYTVGEIVARHLDGYKPYAVANGLWDSGWPGALPILEKDWEPYLDGKIDRATAIGRVVQDYSESQKK